MGINVTVLLYIDTPCQSLQSSLLLQNKITQLYLTVFLMLFCHLLHAEFPHLALLLLRFYLPSYNSWSRHLLPRRNRRQVSAVHIDPCVNPWGPSSKFVNLISRPSSVILIAQKTALVFSFTGSVVFMALSWLERLLTSKSLQHSLCRLHSFIHSSDQQGGLDLIAVAIQPVSIRSNLESDYNNDYWHGVWVWLPPILPMLTYISLLFSLAGHCNWTAWQVLANSRWPVCHRFGW